MVTFKDVKYIPHKHIYSTIYNKYSKYLDFVSYNTFKNNAKQSNTVLIYLDDKEIGFIMYVFNYSIGLLYINYLVLTEHIDYKKELYKYFLTKGYYINYVAYRRHKKNKYEIFKLGGK